MATSRQIAIADQRKKKADFRSGGGSSLHDESLVPATLGECEIPEWLRAQARERISQWAHDDEDREMLLSMILGE